MRSSQKLSIPRLQERLLQTTFFALPPSTIPLTRLGLRTVVRGAPLKPVNEQKMSEVFQMKNKISPRNKNYQRAEKTVTHRNGQKRLHNKIDSQGTRG